MLDTIGESRDSLATKADLDEPARATKADLSALQQAVSERATTADLRNLERAIENLEQAVNEMASKAELRELKRSIRTSMREVELRMTIKFGATLFAVAGLLVALQLLPR